MIGTRLLVAASCLAGATACTGPTYDTSVHPAFTPDSPSVYVAKVKNILVGLPPTDAEIQAVVDDPDALTGLIDTWMALPQYQQKMTVFFELAFQQTQISASDFIDTIPNFGVGGGQSTPLLVQNIRESFARTMVASTMADQPFTDAFGTTKLMMTPALMQLYAFLDARRADNATKVTDLFAKANPTLMMTISAKSGPIPIAESIDPTSPNYMHFYNPDILTQTYPETTCNGLDPISVTANAVNLFEMFYGEIPSHNTALGVSCPIKGGTANGNQLLATDLSTWKLVTIRAPQEGEQATAFYDMPALRNKNELVLTTPHPGFFSTPAFQANWPTNQSNQMRVTMNQTLIVATGTAIDGTDTTSPGTTPGLDMDHAAPGSACFGCHQLLDPTRSIFSATYSWFYNPATDPMLMQQLGQFAFQGVIQPMTSIGDFSRILAHHPLVPGAWVQKLCYYVNSSPCEVNDPEFQRLVADFANGFSWNGLVRELMASPIVTNATDTITHQKHGAVIAVARRDHLCAAINNRLGFNDVCQLDANNQAKLTTIAQIVSGMPSDGYGRGSTVPVLPNQPTLFYVSGLQNICANLALATIDATPDPLQPGVKQWSSKMPDAAIADFVSLLLALTPSDPRAAQATAALTHNFTKSQASPDPSIKPVDALRSTFVAACMSPSFIGIGM